MPNPLSCKSATALDSLPRHTNINRSSSALNRLQQRKQSGFGGEFGRLAPSPSIEQSGLLARKSTSRRPGVGRAASGKRGGQGVASSDLPLASSDLYYDQDGPSSPVQFRDRGAFSDGERGTFSDGEDEEEDDEVASIRIIGLPVRARSVSPTKAHRKPLRTLNGDSGPPSPVVPLSPSARHTPAMPARKRVINKAMIGNPTNFQHTGHVGASSYNALQRGGDAEQLRLQLSEVAAALKLDDDFSGPVRSAAIKTSSESTLASSISENYDEVATKEMQTIVKMPASSPASLPVASESPTKGDTGLKRTTSKRKPLPAPRNLAALYSEFQKDLPEEEEPAAPEPIEFAPSPLETDRAVPVDEESVLQPLPTIRASNGKRLVPGPGGDYITDTANGRWNVALDEITKALKAGGDDDEDDEDMQEGLRRADEVLGKLNALA